ncbi:Rv3235 family protein [Streptomyces sp. NPDC046203]|uniref:Rv3235 family protein n=1 Tax=Streptomyces sp. NPDC046203 TaxID=3154602 RepID=UPI00340AAE5B
MNTRARRTRGPSGPAGTGPRGRAGTAPRRTAPPHVLFAERLLAVLSGDRPVHSMLGYAAGEAYDRLVQAGPRPPFRSTRWRPALHRCGCRRSDGGALEVFAIVATGDSFRALAFRLVQGPDLRWRCSAVEFDDLTEGVRGPGPAAPRAAPGPARERETKPGAGPEAGGATGPATGPDAGLDAGSRAGLRAGPKADILAGR